MALRSSADSRRIPVRSYSLARPSHGGRPAGNYAGRRQLDTEITNQREPESPRSSEEEEVRVTSITSILSTISDEEGSVSGSPSEDESRSCGRSVDKFINRHGQLLETTSCIIVLMSVTGCVVASMPRVKNNFQGFLVLTNLEIGFSSYFILDYAMRLIYHRNAIKPYLTSAWGVVDLLAALLSIPSILVALHADNPQLITWGMGGTQVLASIRTLRMLKLLQHLREFRMLESSLRAEFRFIAIFLLHIAALIVFLASLLHAAEGGKNGFDSVPSAMWWATVTITTVGYGDIVPKTVFGRLVAAVIMLIGYGMLAIPTLMSIMGSMRDDITSRASSQVFPDVKLAREASVSEGSVRGSSHLESVDAWKGAKQELRIALPLRPGDVDSEGFLHCASGHLMLQDAAEKWLRHRCGHSSRAVVMESKFQIFLPLAAGLEELLASVGVRQLSDSSCEFHIFLGDHPHIAQGSLVYMWMAAQQPTVMPEDILAATRLDAG